MFFVLEKKVLKKLDTPHKITLYLNGNNPNIYYYFTWNKKVCRGSTGSPDLKSSIDKVFEIFYDEKKGIRRNRQYVSGSNKFEDVCKKFLEYKDKDHKKSVSQQTMKEYKRITEILKEKFSGENISSLCDENVYDQYQIWRKDYYKTHPNQSISKDGRKTRTYNNVGPVRINRELRLLVSILKYSKSKLGLLPNVEIPPYTELYEEPRRGTLKDEEFERLRDYMSLNRPYQWSIVSFLNSTGIRVGEIQKITWKDVDWDTPCVWIRNRKNPKGGKQVDTPFPLVGSGYDVIETLWKRENPKIGKSEDDFVFTNDEGKPVKSIRQCFKTSLKKCGIDTSICLYSFRHRFTTRMVVQNTIPLLVISRLLGHSTTTMVMKHYEETNKDHYVELMKESREVYYKQKKKKEERKQKQKKKKTKTNTEPDVPLDL